MENIIRNLIKKRVTVKYVLLAAAVVICGIFYCVSMSGNADGNTQNEGLVFSESNSESGLQKLDEWHKQTEVYDYDNQDGDESQSGESHSEGCYVYICGSVVSPGVYVCNKTARVYEVIDMAGGFSEDADTTYLNLVANISDGQKIYVPKQGEKQENEAAAHIEGQETQSALVNINTATAQQLMTLPGIGESRAKDIISYRTKYGNFKSADDIMKVSGIKEAAYEKIKDMICVE